MRKLARAGPDDVPLWGRRLASAPLSLPPAPPGTARPQRPPSLRSVSAPPALAGRSSHPPACAGSQVRASVPLADPRASLDFRISDSDLPPLDDSSCPDTASARDELTEQANKLLNIGWSTTTKTTYERSISSSVFQMERHLDLQLLPLDSPIKIMLVFASLEGNQWSRVRLLKAALRA